MIKLPKVERRKFERYETTTKIRFHIKYSLKTRVSFELLKDKDSQVKKYQGVTRNISVEGLGFSSHKKLNGGDKLYLELYLPHQEEPICMTGEVRWCRKLSAVANYDTGVRLKTINHSVVSRTIHFDKKYGVYWSAVLESVFGNFKKLIKEGKEDLT